MSATTAETTTTTPTVSRGLGRPTVDLTDAQVRELRELRAQNVTYKVLGRKFGVSHHTAGRIIFWESRAEAGGPPPPPKRRILRLPERIDEFRTLSMRTSDMSELATLMGVSKSRAYAIRRASQRS